MPLADANLTLTLRPREFEEVIGLETAVKTVKKTIDEGKIPRAFMITGPYGCGKTTLALIIARYIQGPLFAGTPQVLEINGANYRKIDDIRRIADTTGSFPMVGTYAVIILDECQQLTKDAQQILLKELEIKSSPTIWILPTTDPQLINQGVRDRCFQVKVEGMTEAQCTTLVQRGAEALKFEKPLDEFLTAVNRAKLVSPRKILMAFEMYANGTPAVQAVGAMHYESLPEYFDIAMGVVFGKWTTPYVLPWLNKEMPSVAEQFKKLDERLKKKPVSDTSTADDDGKVEDEDLTQDGKQYAAQAIRQIVATLIKNKVLKGSEKAADAAFVLAHALGENCFGMEWPLTIAALYRVHRKLA